MGMGIGMRNGDGNEEWGWGWGSPHHCLHAEGCGDGELSCVGRARQQPSQEVGEAQRD